MVSLTVLGGVDMLKKVNYPPAKPGALKYEPLKAVF